MHLKARKVFERGNSLLLKAVFCAVSSLLLFQFFIQKSFASSVDTTNFQGRIVIKSSGTNISENSPSCVTTGADTCDFRVSYYDTATGGASLYTEVFSNIELGDHDGIFNLPLGTGVKTEGEETNFTDIFTNHETVFINLELDASGSGDFTSPEVFTTDGTNRMQLRAAAFAITAANVSSNNNQFVKNQTGVQADASFNISGSGTIAGNFAVDGSDATFFVDSTANKVGIGTTSPSAFFSVGPNSEFTINSDGIITSASGLTSSGTITFSGLTSGLLKANSNGQLSIATAGIDYENVLTFKGPLNRVGNTVSIVQASSTDNGYLSSDDWLRFDAATEYISATGDATGFPNRTDTAISFDNENRNFTITGNNFDFYTSGTKFTHSTETIQISNTVGLHYVYYNNSGILVDSLSPWSYIQNTSIATIYWDGSAGLIGDERHGISMDPATRELLHNTVGTSYASGLSGIFADNSFSVDSGIIYGEDLKYSIPTTTQARVLYRTSEEGNYTAAPLSDLYYKTNDGVIQYDDNGTLTDVATDNYVAYWVFATNDMTNPIYALAGQRQDETLPDAEANNSYDSLSLGVLPFTEMKPLYRVILKNVSGVATYVESLDLRSADGISASGYDVASHGSLTGLLEDDHTQYALLAGRSGGQTLIGSVDVSSGLTLQSTSGVGSTGADITFKTGNNGATEAMRILNNGSVGIGTNSAAALLHVKGTNNGTNILIENGTQGYLQFNEGTNVRGYLGYGDANSLFTNQTADSLALRAEGALYIGSGSAADITIGTNGSVGIGTTDVSNGYQLDVSGSTRVTSLNIGTVATSGGESNYALRIDSNGVVYRDTSSIRYKENVNGLTDNFDAILTIEPKSFNYIGQNYQEVGFIAEDLDAAGLNNLVIYDAQGRPDGVKYEKVSLYLLQIIKEQQNDIDSLMAATNLISSNGDLHTINNLSADVFSANTAEINAISSDSISTINLSVSGLLSSHQIETELISAETGKDISVQLSENLGQTKFSIVNTDNNALFSVLSNGNIQVLGKLTFAADSESASVGTIKIENGVDEIRVNTTACTTNSKVFLSVNDSDTSSFPVVKVAEKADGYFVIKLNSPLINDIDVDWWVIN